MSLGVWSFLEEFPETDLKKFQDFGDILTHVSLALIILGMIVFWMSFAGCLGALRENLCFLRLVIINHFFYWLSLFNALNLFFCLFISVLAYYITATLWGNRFINSSIYLSQ